MAKETFTGPIVALGGLAGGTGGTQPREYSDEIGPSIFWGGVAIPATGALASKDRKGPGTIPAISGAYPIRTVNAAIPPGGAAATLTAATAPVANTPILPLATYAAGRAPVPQIVSGVSVNGLAVDMGIDSATFATAGTVTLNVAPTVIGNIWRYNNPGMWIALLNGGASGSCLFTQVKSVNLTTGVITVSPVPAVNGTGQIALTNRFNVNAYGAGAPTGVSSEISAGAARISVPECGNTRGVGIVSVGVGLVTNYLIQGLNGWGVPQSEIIQIPSAAGTTWSKKTYDIFLSCTPLSADTGRTTVQVCVSDFIGLPMSLLSTSGLASIAYAGTPLVITTQYTIIPADTTFPATTTTGDPCGGFQLTANGPAVALGYAAPTTPITIVATSFLTVQQQLDPLAVALATTTNPGPLLGVTPA